MNWITIQDQPFDAPEASALRTALRADLDTRFGGDTEPGVKPTASDITVFLVARHGPTGPALGCGALRALDGTTAEVKRMYVVPAARGRGVGRRLLLALEARARDLGLRRLVLEMGIGRQPEALALYTRGGFAPTPCWGAYAESGTSQCLERLLD